MVRTAGSWIDGGRQASQTSRKRQILFVDDEPELLDGLRRLIVSGIATREFVISAQPVALNDPHAAAAAELLTRAR